MEFIDKIVKKEFEGFGTFSGVVKSYDPASGFFEVLYEDGDSEELELAEVAALVDGKVAVVEEKPRPGRKPKKRRRVDKKCETTGEAGNVCENLVRDSVGNEEPPEKECGFGDSKQSVSANGNLKLSDRFRQTLEGECGFAGESKGIVYVNGDLDTTDNSKDGLDLNAGFNLNLNDCCDPSPNFENNIRKRDCIDLNLDVIHVDPDWKENLNGGDFGVETQKRQCGFDLNLGVDDEMKDAEGDIGGKMKDACLGVNEWIVVMDSTDGAECASKDACLGSVEGIEREDCVSDGDLKVNGSLELLDCKSSDVQLKDGLSEDVPIGTHCCQGDVGGSRKQGNSHRKRRKLSDNVKPATETVLRRSARRGSAQNHVSSTIPSSVVKDQPLSPVISAIIVEKPILSDCEGSEEPSVPLPKPQLPPSSQNLNFDGIPILDLFSVYSCLRSFSTLLYLSPFQLEDFVAAVKCNSPSSLFDCIHVSILQTLRKHLEYLSNEGSQSASDCLRSLSWDLLDLITWPIFMVEYLLIHGSGLKPGLDLNRLKLFKSDYYKQPASLKVEILRCLCDDMIEVEVIRSELNRRSLAAEPDVEFDRNVNFEICKKRKAALDFSGSSCTNMEVDDTNDWNSDECCLCKMDGSLICCDGCPAAYHSRCVGVASDLLPEGDWYCPECVIDRHKPGIKQQKSLRGAELLGIDPHGRPYFSSCGYLLVSDDCDSDVLFNYYHRNDLQNVTEVLKSSDISYSGIVMAIYKHWDIPIGSDKADSSLDSVNHSVCSDMAMKGDIPATFMPLAPLASSETYGVNIEADDERKLKENSTTRDSGNGVEVLKSVSLLTSVIPKRSPNISSQESAEMVQISSGIQNFQKDGLGDSNLATGFLTSISLDIKLKDNSAGPDHVLAMIEGNISEVPCGTVYINCYSFAQTASLIVEELMRKSSEKINDGSIRSDEEMISAQMKAISKKSTKFCWPNIQNINTEVLKEKCGWCFSCKAPSDDRDCLFSMTLGSVQGGSNSEVVAALQTKRKAKGHLIDVMCYMLSVEDRLRGLLLGPWLNPHHSKLWRKNVLEASDVAALKHLLLTLELNLRHRALSAEWLKHVDSVVTMGSASHFSMPSLRASSKHGISRKRAKCSDSEANPSPNAAGGLGLFWWRGGRLSRQVFNWKVLPHSLVSKAARQAGCTKIPGILYPESSEHAKRSKYVVWRAAVESSTSPEQLAFQVRELDLNIRWDDIENTHPFSLLDKGSQKSVRLFKKAIIRRKCMEGEVVKFLLDFGKRKAIPDVVARFGSILEESSSERKKYWLEESYVPLHLLKNFEEKRIARKGNNTKSGKLLEVHRVMKRDSKKRGFSYLFSKAERSEYCQCGHCNKDVLIREAVICLYCKGFFHKRHAKKSAGAVLSECTYTCHRCQDRSSVNVEAKREKNSPNGKKVPSQKGKKSFKERWSVKLKGSKRASVSGQQAQSQNKKEVSDFSGQQIKSENTKRGVQAVEALVPLRRSARKIQHVSLQIQNLGLKKGPQLKSKKGRPLKSNRGRPLISKRGRPLKSKKGTQLKSKRGSQVKSKKGAAKQPTNCTSWRKKRTSAYHSYWLNGLQLSRKPDDKRAMQFKRAMHFNGEQVLAASEGLAAILDQPKCQLCSEAEHASTSSYIACEFCGEWFHGEAFGLDAQNISMLIGFRCHICRKKSPPVCPHVFAVKGDGCKLADKHNSGAECSEASDILPPLNEIPKHESNLNGDRHECMDKEEQHLDSNRSPMSESKVGAEKEYSNARKKQKTDTTQNSDKGLKADVLTVCNNSPMVEQSTHQNQENIVL